MFRTLACALALLLFGVGASPAEEDVAALQPAGLSHLFMHVPDTGKTIDFWVRGLGGVVEQDEELMSPALDQIFGRAGVRIRDTFIRVAGIRLHTIETLDVPREFSEPKLRIPELGIGGISFYVADLDAAHADAVARGLSPSVIYDFSSIEEPVRLFFLESPSRIRVEMIEKAH